MENKKIAFISINLDSILLWSALLCILWLGHFNNWWPYALPLVFTIIISAYIGICLIIALVMSIVAFISDRY